eukprot:5995126-Alexandrium_andersonii.AAC.1
MRTQSEPNPGHPTTSKSSPRQGSAERKAGRSTEQGRAEQPQRAERIIAKRYSARCWRFDPSQALTSETLLNP